MGVHPVNRGTRGDARSVAALLAEAFEWDPVSRWLLPDAVERRRRHMRFLLLFVEHALDCGEVQLYFDDGYAGAALWLHVEPAQQVPGPNMGRIKEVLGPDALDRFLVLDKQMHDQHPMDMPHAYLPFVAVASHRRGLGIGRRLLSVTLEMLDAQETPAYLEASSERSCHLYQRLGFRPHGEPLLLPDGPVMYPMLRDVPQYRHPGNSRWPSWVNQR